MLGEVAEISQYQYRVFIVVAEIAKYMIITGIDNFRFGSGKGQILLADLDQPQQTLVDSARNSGKIPTLLGPHLIEGQSVQPAGIANFSQIFFIIIIPPSVFI